MKNPARVLANILDCTMSEVDMLLETDIDIASTVQCITENGYELNMATLYDTAFHSLVWDMLAHLPEFDEYDFELYYNGSQDTHMYIKGTKADYYREKTSFELDEIENIMNMEFGEI